MFSLGCRYLMKAAQTNPLIKQVVTEFMNNRAKYAWFEGSPLAVLIPLLATAKQFFFFVPPYNVHLFYGNQHEQTL